jgi:hypothetical protein
MISLEESLSMNDSFFHISLLYLLTNFFCFFLCVFYFLFSLLIPEIVTVEARTEVDNIRTQMW